jgi:hypothetical protein
MIPNNELLAHFEEIEQSLKFISANTEVIHRFAKPKADINFKTIEDVLDYYQNEDITTILNSSFDDLRGSIEDLKDEIQTLKDLLFKEDESVIDIAQYR